MKTLNNQYRLIKEGKGHKDVFLKEAKAQFPNWIRNAATYTETTAILKNKGIINENVIGLEPINQLVTPPKEGYEVAFSKFLEEAKKKQDTDAKAEEKEISKHVKDTQDKNFDRKNMEDPNNLIFDQVMAGYYCEVKNPKNSKKTMDELKKIVFKNLAKDPIYYTKNDQFGVEGVGYETEVPGLGRGKQIKNSGTGGGYGLATKKKFPEGEVGTGYLEVPKKIKGSGLKVKKVTTLNENKLRKVVNNLIREELNENKSDKHIDAVWSIWDKHFNGERNPKFIEQGNNSQGWVLDIYDDEMSNEELDHMEMFYKEAVDYLKDNNVDFQDNGNQLYIPKPTEELNESHQPGDKVIYKGTKYEVVDEDEFIITLKDEEGNITKQNYNQFKQGETTPSYKPHSTDGNPEDTDMPSWMMEQKLRKTINTMVRQQIQENVQKELQQIDKEAQSEILASKLEKIEAAIDKRQSQLDRLDEDEDLKNLTDKKKLKAIAKDIKVLGKAKAKIEKELAKKDKSDKPQPEMIDDGIIDEADGDVDDAKAVADETERAAAAAKEIGDTELFEKDDEVTDKDADEYLAQQEKYAEDGVDKGETSTNYSDKSSNEPSEEYLEAKEEAESRYEEGEEIESIIKDYPEFKEMLFHDLKGKFEGSDY